MGASSRGINLVRDEVACCFSTGKVILLQLTNSCNQLCLHCMRDAGPFKLEAVDLTQLHGGLEFAAATLRPDRVVISGGEPTLVPNLVQVVELVDSTGTKSSLCTNATLVDVGMARALSHAGLKSATVGLEDVGVEYDHYRQSRGGFVRALRGIANLQEAGIPVTVNITLNVEVLDRLAEVAKMLLSIKPRKVCVTSPMLQGRLLTRPTTGRVTRLDLDSFVRQLENELKRLVMVRVPRCSAGTCPSGVSVFSMTAHGDLGPCPDTGALNVIDASL